MTHLPPLRVWKWDLQEMREAAVMDESIMDETLEDLNSTPLVSSVTPINHPTAPVHAQHEDAAIKSKSTDKPKAPKRRKTQPSATTIAPKPRKAATSKKTKRAKTAAQLDCQDISQGLSRTKPISSRDEALPMKAGSSFGDIPFEQNAEMPRVGDKTYELKVKPAFNDSKKESKRSRPANKYKAAYVDVPDDAYDRVSPPTPPKSDEVEAEVPTKTQSRGQDSATNRQATPNDYVEPSIEKSLKTDSSTIIRDFGAPPFIQTSPPRLQDRGSQGTMMVDDFDSLDLIPADLIEVDDIGCGDHDDDDDFPMDDDCLEEIMQSMALPAEAKFVCSDSRPQGLSGATLRVDEQFEDDQSHWPRAISDPDGVAVYDEDPTLVASDNIDVPSSAQCSSQASCILTHVEGNANSDRPGMSGGSENCFDDNDLDDVLIDLTVDENNPPITPAKRPLSPKLLWKSPKMYTPEKSSRKPISPNEAPHVVPMDSHGNALPFTRPPFPKAVQDRSPIMGLTNRTVLRICFRIGEALNAAAVASRENVDAIIELYARVVSSSREASGGYKQYFQFGDLFTDKPPYLSGTYSFWKGVGLWDLDSKEFVGEQGRGKMARVVGRIKKTEPGRGQGPGIEMVVLSIWEVDWEDVGVAKGIACPKEI